MACSRIFVAALLSIVVAACGNDDEHGGATTAPAAPSDLQVTVLSDGAHLTWSDNSDNEDHFMVMRKEQGGGEFDDVAMTTFDIEQYHDGSVTSGKTYLYKVIAMNGAGEASSAEVTFAAP